MEVILIDSVGKLGRIGQTIKVKDGYARNYLMPNSLAVPATKENVAKFAAMQKDLEQKNSEKKKAAEAIAKSLPEKHLIYILQAASDGKLFGSVSAKSIAGDLSKIIKHELGYSNILLDSPIKSIGVYNVEVSLHPEVSAIVPVVIGRTDSEALDALKEYKAGHNKDKGSEQEEEIL